jgi:hypothetical protein
MVGWTLHIVHGMVEAKAPRNHRLKARWTGPERVENEGVMAEQDLRRDSCS